MKKDNPNNLNVHEMEIASRQYAYFEVKREQKHLKAYIKGQKFYKVYGRTYPVLTPEVIAQQEHMALSAEPIESKQEEE